VVASPCALVILTPASTLSALANAARHGILFKGAAHLEDIGVARVVAFDKTGTLTVGRPRMTDLRPAAGVDPDELLRLTAAVERLSEHPLGAASGGCRCPRRTRAPRSSAAASRRSSTVT
ncbi:MAG TPA: HAD family hydrolase, partial [Thermomicrobiales bacterium]|nr:HAD family hydrolase [Thermomicrobiales bacterium]